jgi:uncharacterized protein YaeQ
MFGEDLKQSRNLDLWGEAGVITARKHFKTCDKGSTMMFVGYSNQESDSIQMWDQQTVRVIVTHDAIRLEGMYFQPLDAV